MIKGTSLDELTAFSMRLAGVNEDEFESEEEQERKKLEEKMFL